LELGAGWRRLGADNLLGISTIRLAIWLYADRRMRSNATLEKDL
jgi:hypothetical protein